MPIESIQQDALKADEYIRKVSGIKNWTVSASRGFNGGAQVNFTIRAAETGSQKSMAALRAEVRKAMQPMTGYSIRVSEPADPLAGSSGRFQPIAVNVTGDDIGTLMDFAQSVRATMSSTEGISDVSPLLVEGLPEIRIKTDPLVAAHFGLTTKFVADEVHTWVEGNTRNNLQMGTDRIPIRVRMKDSKNMSVESLQMKQIFLQNGTRAVPVSSLGQVEIASGPAVISRENRQRTLRVGANLASGAALGEVAEELEDRLAQMPLPKGVKARIVGQNEQMSELFSNVAIALGLGCLFMYMVLASLFESFAQPLTVMAAVPLAATGAVLALLAFGFPLDLYGGIGMILLAGIVAKNSILLVDFAMQRVRDAHVSPMDAIRETAPLRLRPILMTSIAMIVGMLPVATGLGAGGAARQSLGISTIGGIISSTFLTLLVVPNLYVVIERLRRKS
jgi:multidrug efflux pump subunit AcrB